MVNRLCDALKAVGVPFVIGNVVAEIEESVCAMVLQSNVVLRSVEVAHR